MAMLQKMVDRVSVKQHEKMVSEGINKANNRGYVFTEEFKNNLRLSKTIDFLGSKVLNESSLLNETKSILNVHKDINRVISPLLNEKEALTETTMIVQNNYQVDGKPHDYDKPGYFDFGLGKIEYNTASAIDIADDVKKTIEDNNKELEVMYNNVAASLEEIKDTNLQGEIEVEIDQDLIRELPYQDEEKIEIFANTIQESIDYLKVCKYIKETNK